MPQLRIDVPDDYIRDHVTRALEEDFSVDGDITSKALIDPHRQASAKMIAKQDGVVCGLRCAEMTFRMLDEKAEINAVVKDGTSVIRGNTVMEIKSNARALLGAERTALNFMGRLSGIASMTKLFSDRIMNTHARICDTRKTTPGFRLLEKYAVACGGGANHRIGLYDAILIKDNHLAVAGSVELALKRAQNAAGDDIEIEIEVDNIDQLREALRCGARRVLLDNMSLDELRACVSETRGRAILEASGNVTLETVRQIAETGVDLISSGALTHSAPVLDLSLEVTFS